MSRTACISSNKNFNNLVPLTNQLFLTGQNRNYAKSLKRLKGISLNYNCHLER